jgi:hypothetical protein
VPAGFNWQRIRWWIEGDIFFFLGQATIFWWADGGREKKIAGMMEPEITSFSKNEACPRHLKKKV